jgi:CRP/FNR family cyclic AMP-dependent transcriptional regulator
MALAICKKIAKQRGGVDHKQHGRQFEVHLASENDGKIRVIISKNQGPMKPLLLNCSKTTTSFHNRSGLSMPGKPTMAMADKARRGFDPKVFLATIGEGREIVLIAKKQVIYAQGAACNGVFHIQEGMVRLAVVAKNGKEATLGILNPGDFFGEGGLAGQPQRMGSAIALTDCALLRIEKKAMMLALHKEHALTDLFTAYLLGRNIRYEADLVDQLFNSSEKRLARTLLLLAQLGTEGKPETVVPKISQETLAEMIGTTRARVNFFMNRFRKLGFIDYNGALVVHSSLLDVVLHD